MEAKKQKRGPESSGSVKEPPRKKPSSGNTGAVGLPPSIPLYFPNRKLIRSDYDVPCVLLAKFLLGKTLVRRIDDQLISGIIVETECYLGDEDAASHSYKGKLTPRNEAMFMPPGTCYVYMTYGLYHCMNISSQGYCSMKKMPMFIGPGAAVLIRAIEPLSGMTIMTQKRNSFLASRKKPTVKPHYLPKELCNGPSKLCISFGIDVSVNKMDLVTWSEMWIEDNKNFLECNVVCCKRIGIDSAGPIWANKPLRYYILGNSCISKQDKLMEQKLITST